MDISVVVPTCNRSGSLKDTLVALDQQAGIEQLAVEIIVVDNNSRDDTRAVVTQQAAVGKTQHLRHVLEPAQGAAWTRNRGVREARGEILAFIDDDCVPERDWLRKIWDCFQQDRELDCLLGGCRFENGRPFYADPTKSQSVLRGNGLNMSFRKKVFEDLGLFDVFLGPGSIGCSGEDTELVYRVSRAGRKTVIAEDILVVHKDRESAQARSRVLYRDYRGHTVFLLKHALRGDMFAAKNIYWLVKGVVSNVWRRLVHGQNARSEFVKLGGIVSGLARGSYIWLILAPIKSICRK